MSSKANVRKTTQLWACRAVLSNYLDGDQLEKALLDLKHMMRHGPQAWAFKRASEDDDERTYYKAGAYEHGTT